MGTRYKDQPWTEYAKNLSEEELRRRHYKYYWMHWSFWLGYAVFVVAATYFPWAWLAHWSPMRAFADFMAALFPIIDELRPELRHHPLWASKIQIAVIHAAGVAFLAWRLLTQPRIALPQYPLMKLFWLGAIGTIWALGMLYIQLVSVGIERGGWVWALHETGLGSVFAHSFYWIGLTHFAWLAKAFWMELYWQPRDPKPIGDRTNDRKC